MLEGIGVGAGTQEAVFKFTASYAVSRYVEGFKATVADRALRRGPWKLVENELYHLEGDPIERKGFTKEYPQRFEQMMKERSAIYQDAINDSSYD